MFCNAREVRGCRNGGRYVIITSPNRPGLPDFSRTHWKTWEGLGTRLSWDLYGCGNFCGLWAWALGQKLTRVDYVPSLLRGVEVWIGEKPLSWLPRDLEYQKRFCVDSSAKLGFHTWVARGLLNCIETQLKHCLTSAPYIVICRFVLMPSGRKLVDITS